MTGYAISIALLPSLISISSTAHSTAVHGGTKAERSDEKDCHGHTWCALLIDKVLCSCFSGMPSSICLCLYHNSVCISIYVWRLTGSQLEWAGDCCEDWYFHSTRLCTMYIPNLLTFVELELNQGRPCGDFLSSSQTPNIVNSTYLRYICICSTGVRICTASTA